MTDVFLSYSRADEDLVDELRRKLEADDRKVWVDTARIRKGAKWLAAIRHGIEGSKAFVFLVTNSSVDSEVCRQEIGHAVTHNKKILPLCVVSRFDIENLGRLDKAIAEINWIELRGADDANAYQMLIEALDTDLDWVAEHTRILTRAIEWEGDPDNASLLMRGSDLKRAEHWLEESADKRQKPSKLHYRYLRASQEYERREAARWKQLYETSEHRLRGVCLTNGERSMGEGDLLASLPWFVEALGLGPNKAITEAGDRLRLGLILRCCPRPSHLWFCDDTVVSAEFSPDGQSLARAQLDGNVHVSRLSSDGNASLLLQHGGRVGHVAFSPSGDRLVTSCEDGSARLWSAATGEQLGPSLKHDAPVLKSVFTFDGALVATVAANATATLWSTATGEKYSSCDGRVVLLRASPSDPWLALYDGGNSVTIWDYARQEDIGEPILHANTVVDVVFSPNGHYLATASADSRATVWSSKERALFASLQHGETVTSAAFSDDGHILVTGSLDRTAMVWEVAKAKRISAPIQHESGVEHVRFLRGGHRFVTATQRGAIRTFESVWNVFDWRPNTSAQPVPPIHLGAPIYAINAHPHRDAISVGTYDARALVWELDAGLFPRALEHRPGETVHWARFNPSGTRVVTASLRRKGGAYLWDREGGSLIAALQHQATVIRASFSPDGTRLVTASLDRTARVWDGMTGERLLEPLQHDGRVYHAEFSPDSTLIVSASANGRARLWNAISGAEIETHMVHEADVVHATFNPGGTRIVTSSKDGTARIWDVSSGTAVGAPLKHDGDVLWAQFSPDGLSVVTASWDGTARIWNAKTGKPISDPLRHRDQVFHAEFHPDGSSVVTASGDQTAVLWDAASGKPIGSPMLHEDTVFRATFDANGSLLATASHDGTARIWDARTSEPLSPPLQHASATRRGVEEAVAPRVQDVQFSCDSGSLLTAAAGAALIWELPTAGQSKEELERVATLLSNRRIDEDGALVVANDYDLEQAWSSG